MHTYMGSFPRLFLYHSVLGSSLPEVLASVIFLLIFFFFTFPRRLKFHFQQSDKHWPGWVIVRYTISAFVPKHDTTTVREQCKYSQISYWSKVARCLSVYVTNFCWIQFLSLKDPYYTHFLMFIFHPRLQWNLHN